MMKLKSYRHPWLFYGLSTLIPWFFWGIAAYLSHLHPKSHYIRIVSMLGLTGLSAPMLVAFWLMYKDDLLKKDLCNRFFNFKSSQSIYWILALFLMLVSIITAQALSLLFGYSTAQFKITGHYSFSSGIFPVWFILLVAPVLEELGWHTYGTDTLRNRFNLFQTSLIFALFWGAWHIPLSLIKDYYQNHLVATGWLYSINFLVSIFPFVILMNWLYYKTGRNILVAIIFHITAGFFNEIFATHPMSKVIQTGLLVALASYIVLKEKAFFFDTKTVAILEKHDE